jgi:DNA-binding NtrC family response regulator
MAEILVVEDEESVGRLIQLVLASMKHEVRLVPNGKMALEINQAIIDLLISDIILPCGIKGYQLADRLQETHPEMKVLFISGFGEETLPENTLRKGRVFLQKPFTLEVLKSTVTKLLNNNGARHNATDSL